MSGNKGTERKFTFARFLEMHERKTSRKKITPIR